MQKGSTLSKKFSVTVTSVIEFPADFTYSVMNEITRSFTFELEVKNLCELEASLQAFTLSPMKANILGETTIMSMPEVVEVSGKDCGEIIMEITDAEIYKDYLTVEDTNLVLKSTRNTDEGQRIVKIKAFLKDFTNVETEAELTVTIDPCRVLDFTITIPETSYEIGSGAFETAAFTI